MLQLVYNFSSGVKQVIPTKKFFDRFKKSPDLQANYIQILYFNLVSYFFPVALYNYIIKPVLDYIEIFTGDSSINTFIKYSYLLYVARLITEMLLYNTVLTFTTARLSAIDNDQLTEAVEKYKKESKEVCDHTQSDKLRNIVRSPLYYISNHIFAGIIDKLINPYAGKIIKAQVYGRALAEVYLDQTEMCADHKKSWLSNRNFLCLGIGGMFILLHTLSYAGFSQVSGLLYPSYTLDPLSDFVIQDILFNLIWFTMTTAILTGPNILLIKPDYILDLFKFNNLIALKAYDAAKPAVKSLIIRNGQPNQWLLEIKKLYSDLQLYSLIQHAIPQPFQSAQKLIKTPPMQLLMATNRSGLLQLSSWLATLNRARPILVSTDWIGAKGYLQGILKRWLPETLIVIVFDLISKNTFSEQNLNWFNMNVNHAASIPATHRLGGILNRLKPNFTAREFEILSISPNTQLPAQSVISTNVDDWVHVTPPDDGEDWIQVPRPNVSNDSINETTVRLPLPISITLPSYKKHRETEGSSSSAPKPKPGIQEYQIINNHF